MADENKNSNSIFEQFASNNLEQVAEDNYKIKTNTIDYKDDPRLDPSSEQFDADLYKEAFESFKEKLQISHDLVKENAQQISSMVDLGEDTLTKLHDVIQFLLHNVAVANDGFKSVFPQEMLENARQIVKQVEENFFSFVDGAQELADLIPYIEEELKENYQGLTFDQLIEEVELDENKTPVKGTRYEKVLKAATYRKLKAENTTPSIVAKKPNNLDFSVDKVNATVWRLLADEKGQIPGQISFANYTEEELLPIAVEGRNDKKNGKERTIYYAIDFNTVENDLSISKRLNAFDRRVYEAIGTLFNANNEIVSLTQIYAAMGNIGRPGTGNIDRISESIDKMASARILLDRTEDYKKYSKNSNLEMKYKGPLLAMERIDATINGQLVEGAIHLFREPVLMTFAREKNQITTIPRPVIETKKRQTENNLEIENYLLERIARMKNNSSASTNKILYQTIFEKANIKKGKPQQRAIPTILEYLEHYKKTKWIKDYKEVKDGVEIKY